METLRAGDAEVTIDHARGGRLASVVVGGHELLVGGAEGLPGPTGWGCFPMIPWAGRIRHGRFLWHGRPVQLPLGLPPHAIHGTTHLQEWEQTGPGRLSCPLGPDWPWAGTAHQRFRLTEQGLSATIRVEAHDGPMPVTAGWHPWFRRRVDEVAVRVDLPARRMWQRDRDGIPDVTLVEPPPGPWDDCFTGVTWPVVLRWPGVIRLSVESTCRHVVVYDEQPHAVCVEPQSGPPDAHNSGNDLAIVTPDRPLELHSTWTWRVETT